MNNYINGKQRKHSNQKGETGRIKKNLNPTIYFLQYKHFRFKGTNRVKVNRWKK